MKRAWAFCAFVMAAACVHGPSTDDGGRELSFWASGEESETVRVQEDRYVGADLRVQRTSDGLRGIARGHPLVLSLAPDVIRGTWANAPFQLTLASEDDGIRAQGLVLGQLGQFLWSPRGFEGQVGECGYSLRETEGELTGFRSCGGRPQVPARLRIPRGFAGRPRAEAVALLALLMAR